MAGDWVEYKDEEGRSYYFNSVTEETTWDRPAEFDALDNEKGKGRSTAQLGDLDAEGVSPDRLQSPSMEIAPESPAEEPDDLKVETDVQEESVEDMPKEEDIDPAVKRLEDAKKALSQPDAIMENGTLKFSCLIDYLA
jgi:hypothetical protein